MDNKKLLRYTSSNPINAEEQNRVNVSAERRIVINQEDISGQISWRNYDSVVAIRQKAGKLKEHVPMREAMVEQAFSELNQNKKIDKKERDERIKHMDKARQNAAKMQGVLNRLDSQETDQEQKEHGWAQHFLVSKDYEDLVGEPVNERFLSGLNSEKQEERHRQYRDIFAKLRELPEQFFELPADDEEMFEKYRTRSANQELMMCKSIRAIIRDAEQDGYELDQELKIELLARAEMSHDITARLENYCQRNGNFYNSFFTDEEMAEFQKAVERAEGDISLLPEHWQRAYENNEEFRKFFNAWTEYYSNEEAQKTLKEYQYKARDEVWIEGRDADIEMLEGQHVQWQAERMQEMEKNYPGLSGIGELRVEADKTDSGIPDAAVLYVYYTKAKKRLLNTKQKEELQRKFQDMGTGFLERNVYNQLKLYRTKPNGEPLTPEDQKSKEWNDGFVQSMLNIAEEARNPYLKDIVQEIRDTEIPSLEQVKDPQWLAANLFRFMRLLDLAGTLDNLEEDDGNRHYFGYLSPEKRKFLDEKCRLITEYSAWAVNYIKSLGVTVEGTFIGEEAREPFADIASDQEEAAVQSVDRQQEIREKEAAYDQRIEEKRQEFERRYGTGRPDIALLRSAADHVDPDIPDVAVLLAYHRYRQVNLMIPQEQKRKLQEKYGAETGYLSRNIEGFLKVYRKDENGMPVGAEAEAAKRWNDGFLEAMLSEDARKRDPYLKEIYEELEQIEVPSPDQLMDTEWFIAHMDEVMRKLSLTVRLDNLENDKDNKAFFDTISAERKERMNEKYAVFITFGGFLKHYMNSLGCLGSGWEFGNAKDRKVIRNELKEAETDFREALREQEQKRRLAMPKQEEVWSKNVQGEQETHQVEFISEAMTWSHYESVRVRKDKGELKEITPMREAMLDEAYRQIYADEEMSAKERKARLKHMDDKAVLGREAERLMNDYDPDSEHNQRRVLSVSRWEQKKTEAGEAFNPSIMGKRWLHFYLEEGVSGEEQERNEQFLNRFRSTDRKIRHEAYEQILQKILDVPDEAFEIPTEDEALMEHFKRYYSMLSAAMQLKKEILGEMKADDYEPAPEVLKQLLARDIMSQGAIGVLDARMKLIANVYNGILTEEELEELKEMDLTDIPEESKWFRISVGTDQAFARLSLALNVLHTPDPMFNMNLSVAERKRIALSDEQ